MLETNMLETKHRLRFNPSKTECTLFSNCNLDPYSGWMLNDVKRKESNSV